MRHFSFLITLVLLTCIPVQAQWPPQTKNAVRVLYSRSVPAVVRQQIPPGGETKFYGVWRPDGSRRDFPIHFYSAPTKGDSLLCKVDIFERSHGGKRNQLKRINSIRLSNNPTLFKYVTNNAGRTVVTLTYSADVVWVKQKKQLPLLRFHVVSSGGLHGQYGDYVLINLPYGWDKQANVQYFSWGGAIQYSYTVDFNKVDARGYMMITTTYTEYNGVENVTTEQELFWNGKKFSKSDGNK